MTTSTRTTITGIGTIRIPVRDQDVALRFYCGQLGFEVRVDAAFGSGSRWLEVAPEGAATSIALVSATPDDPAGIATGISLNAVDAAADHARLAAAGVLVEPLMEMPLPMFVFRDPDGNRIRVVQRPEGS